MTRHKNNSSTRTGGRKKDRRPDSYRNVATTRASTPHRSAFLRMCWVERETKGEVGTEASAYGVVLFFQQSHHIKHKKVKRSGAGALKTQKKNNSNSVRGGPV